MSFFLSDEQIDSVEFVHPKDVHGIPGKGVASDLRELLLRLRDGAAAQ